MILQIDGHPCHYEMESLCDIFVPYEKVTVVYGRDLPETEPTAAYTGMRVEEGMAQLLVSLTWEGRTEEARGQFPCDHPDFERQCGIEMAILLYGLFVRAAGYEPQWGILVGVRPIKLLRQLCAGMGEAEAVEYFQSRLRVSPEKTRLSVQTMRQEEKLLALSRPESFSLYISIPFCPTRCAYCSFVAQTLEQTARLVPEYVELLCRELQKTAQVAQDLGLRLETVYVGGGTPTSLSAPQLGTVLSAVREYFSLDTCREWTVEAGRPDTFSKEKLRVMQEAGVTRLSINPQTFDDRVLRRIGRGHTTEQTLEAFAMARGMGFGNINMDLIAGLPGETEEGFCHSLEEALRLSPESITVHTLSLKRSSRLNQDGKGTFVHNADAVGAMLREAQEKLSEGGYRPYYLYRQSRMAGNLENTGWAKPGYENLYNVYIMDETHTILACGAGAVSKVRDPGSSQLVRIFNFKYPHEYRSRFAEMLERKDKVRETYARFRCADPVQEIEKIAGDV